MKQLSARQVAQKEAHLDRIGQLRDELGGGITTFNEAIEALFDEHVTPWIDKLNAEIEEAADFCRGVHDDQQNYYDERSEKWIDGEVGQRYAEWLSSWEQDLETVDPDDLRPSCEVEMPDIPAFDVLSDMADELE